MSSKPAKIVGILSLIAGLVMLVAGLVTWNIVSSHLKDERITVPPDASTVMGVKVAGKEVAGPITAYGQAQTIKKHALKATEGKTYAELGDDVNAAKAELEAAKDDTAKQAAQTKVDAAQGKRTTIMNAAFLRSSLFSSVITYGVSALVMGLGLMHLLFGWALLSLAKKAVAGVIDRDRDRDGVVDRRDVKVDTDRGGVDDRVEGGSTRL